MSATKEKLSKIYDKTRGKCHLCHKQLAFKNYGCIGSRGAWEIEHSKPKSRGGTDHLNNLYASCIKCNREKGNGTNYSTRSKNGVKKAPLSESKRKKVVVRNSLKSAAIGAAAGRFFGPTGAVIGGIVGGVVGFNENPDE